MSDTEVEQTKPEVEELESHPLYAVFVQHAVDRGKFLTRAGSHRIIRCGVPASEFT